MYPFSPRNQQTSHGSKAAMVATSQQLPKEPGESSFGTLEGKDFASEGKDFVSSKVFCWVFSRRASVQSSL